MFRDLPLQPNSPLPVSVALFKNASYPKIVNNCIQSKKLSQTKLFILALDLYRN